MAKTMLPHTVFASPAGSTADPTSPASSADSPTRVLSLRSTFIDVIDEEPEAQDMTIVRSKRRVKTAPCQAFVGRETLENFSVERAYVRNLSDKMAALASGAQRTTMEFFEADTHITSPIHPLEPCYIATRSTQDSSFGVGMSRVPDPARVERLVARSMVSAPPPGFDDLPPPPLVASGFPAPLPTNSAQGTVFPTPLPTNGAQGTVFPTPLPTKGASANEIFVVAPPMTTKDKNAPKDPLTPGLLPLQPATDNGSQLCDSDNSEGIEEQVATNLGSIGHPELCNRPCLFFAAGTCISFDGCEFCHNSHKKRLAHLDKRHRDMLHELTLERWSALVLPMLKQRVLAVDSSATTAAILNSICFPCSGGFEDALQANRQAPWINRQERTVFLKLKSMTLRSLLATVERSLEHRAIEVNGSVELLLNHLRAILAR